MRKINEMNEITKIIIVLIILILLVMGIVYFMKTPGKNRDVQLKNDPDTPRYAYNSWESVL